jgi:phage terminase Nu1 subunit (DNA packaging protein)
MAVTLITQAEYARRRGVDPTTVRDAIRAGRITLIDGKVDPDVADVQWARNTRVRVGSGQRRADPQSAADDPFAAPSLETYEEARRRREMAEAQKAELQLAELQGDLIRTADVRAAHAKRVAGLREALLQIPARLAAVVAAEADQGRCHDILQAELHQVLGQITEE